MDDIYELAQREEDNERFNHDYEERLSDQYDNPRDE